MLAEGLGISSSEDFYFQEDNIFEGLRGLLSKAGVKEFKIKNGEIPFIENGLMKLEKISDENLSLVKQSLEKVLDDL